MEHGTSKQTAERVYVGGGGGADVRLFGVGTLAALCAFQEHYALALAHYEKALALDIPTRTCCAPRSDCRCLRLRSASYTFLVVRGLYFWCVYPPYL